MLFLPCSGPGRVTCAAVRVRRPRIAELPAALQPPARFVRGLVKKSSYMYEGDGIATKHFTPFLDDPGFQARYEKVAHTWPGSDNRWRLWILTRSAMHCAPLDGSFAEFGVYRGGCTFMVLSECRPRSHRSVFLFDTFAGIPTSRLTEYEEGAGFGGRLADVSVEEVRARLAPWSDQVRFVAGDVFETLSETETGPLAFAHLDMNASAPTKIALDYVWSRMVPGGMMVFDDYGWAQYADQKKLIDDFFGDKPDGLMALPTGQALSVKV
jgi:O-methyltransferase